jgi:fructose-specific phosphotransferase system IIC component
MRVFSGAVLGYLLFAILSFLLFRVTRTDPHASAGISFEIGSILFGLLFALLAGYVASLVGGRPDFVAAWTVGALIAVSAIASMVMTGVAWSEDGGAVVYGARSRHRRRSVCEATAAEGQGRCTAKIGNYC